MELNLRAGCCIKLLNLVGYFSLHTLITSQLTSSETRNKHATNPLITASNSETTLKKTRSSRRKHRNVYRLFFTTFTPTFTTNGSSYYYVILSTMCKSRLHSSNRTHFVSGHVAFNRFVQRSCQVPLIFGGQHKTQLYSLRHHE